MIHRVLSKLPLSTSRMPSSRGICRCGWLDPGFKLLSPREAVLYCIGDGIISSSSACINNKRLVLLLFRNGRNIGRTKYYYVDSACWPLSKYLDNRSGKLKRFGPGVENLAANSLRYMFTSLFNLPQTGFWQVISRGLVGGLH